MKDGFLESAYATFTWRGKGKVQSVSSKIMLESS